MVIQRPAGVHREIVPFEYSAADTSIARAATRFRESERADVGSMSVRAHEQLGAKLLFRDHVTVRQVCLIKGALFSSVRFPLHHPVSPSQRLTRPLLLHSLFL
jgi:hypothetical protein